MWIAPESNASLQQALFEFLSSVAEGNPRARRPLVAEANALRELYGEPNAVLIKTIERCLESLASEISLDPACWGKLEIPTWILGVALATNNSLIDKALQEAGESFTVALIRTLPAASGVTENLCYQALLSRAVALVKKDARKGRRNLHALIERSPLATLWFLDTHTPAALLTLAKELLPRWQPNEIVIKDVWRSDDEWMNAVGALLSNPDISRALRHRWLVMPESRRACRNVGLVLEALRRRDEHRAFCLEFYEAYDYFRAELKDEPSGGQTRVWPIFSRIEQLVRVPGDNEAAIRVNRWGNEYFLKFQPLVNMIVAEEGLPKDYQLLTLPFASSMQSVLPYITYGDTGISFGEVTFE
ncbi:MAG TPA: hypothetical protein VFX97_05525 [Pyrinomonadaceae bacterium]|nr:hypothetical protein [Pyrinomonadaceae bacterium]